MINTPFFKILFERCKLIEYNGPLLDRMDPPWMLMLSWKLKKIAFVRYYYSNIWMNAWIFLFFYNKNIQILKNIMCLYSNLESWKTHECCRYKLISTPFLLLNSNMFEVLHQLAHLCHSHILQTPKNIHILTNKIIKNQKSIY